MARANGTVTPGERFDGIDARLLNLEEGQQKILRKMDVLWWKVSSVSAFSGAGLALLCRWFFTKGA